MLVRKSHPAYRALQAALRDARAAAGLTQAELGARLGVDVSVISRVESGDRRIDAVELVAYCGGLGVDAVELVRVVDLEVAREARKGGGAARADAGPRSVKGGRRERTR